MARAHYAQRQLLAATAAEVAARHWAAVDRNSIAANWSARLPAVMTAVAGAQLAAAQGADPYVSVALAADGLSPAAQATVVAAAFAGQAADGRDLLTLLYQPAITTLTAIGGGADPGIAMGAGALQLDTAVRTEVADAGRAADQVATTTRPAATGYVRVVVGATCSRCIILAGRVYPWSTGFLRHPRCDCVMMPAAVADAAGFAQWPERVYAAMSPEQRSAAGWSKAEQRAIADGADIASVTNIHRGGLYVAGGRQFTYEAARKGPRPTPAQIYRDATDRADAVRLLRRHGYIR